MGPTPRHSASLGIGAYTLRPYLSYNLCPLATNPRNIRYHTLRYRGVAPRICPSYTPLGGRGRDFATVSFRECAVSQIQRWLCPV